MTGRLGIGFVGGGFITRFHVQNDFGDWDTVHHAFTAAHALHAALMRMPTRQLLSGLVHGALRVYLDRFLNVPAARLPDAQSGDLAWNRDGQRTRQPLRPVGAFDGHSLPAALCREAAAGAAGSPG